MGVLDSIKQKLGMGGSGERGSGRGRMRQPPEGPSASEGPGRSRSLERNRGLNEGGGGPGDRSPPVGGGNRPQGRGRPDLPSERSGGSQRTGNAPQGSRETGGAGGAGGASEASDLDFEPGGESGTNRGISPDRSGSGSGPAPASGAADRNEGGMRDTGIPPAGGDEGGGKPSGYNLDLPREGGGEDDRLDRIYEQNDRIIDLLEDIKDDLEGQRGGGRR